MKIQNVIIHCILHQGTFRQIANSPQQVTRPTFCVMFSPLVLSVYSYLTYLQNWSTSLPHWCCWHHLTAVDTTYHKGPDHSHLGLYAVVKVKGFQWKGKMTCSQVMVLLFTTSPILFIKIFFIVQSFSMIFNYNVTKNKSDSISSNCLCFLVLFQSLFFKQSHKI